MSKITLEEWTALVTNVDTSDEEIMAISKIVAGEGAFDFRLAPDPKAVDMASREIEAENAMAIANDLSRRRRSAQFRKRQLLGVDKPVLVSEMDSWGQFPIVIREIVDHLNKDFMVWSVGAAGDTAQNMVFGPLVPRRTEYVRALMKQKKDVKAFVFSAAGNDIIGEDPDTGRPVIRDLIKPFNGNHSDVEGHIDHVLLAKKLNFLRGAYSKVINDIRSVKEFENLPIIIHGYDVPYPYPWGASDKRNPAWAKNDKWLGSAFKAKGIDNKKLGRPILAFLIDSLYDMLGEFSRKPKESGVWLVNCRGALPKVTDWADEIHGTSDGFKKVASRFKTTINKAIKNAEEKSAGV